MQKTSFCILVDIYCHNIPTQTPQSGYHGVTEVAKTANTTKMDGKCRNCISAHPTPPHTNPMESGPGTLFRLKIGKKTKRFMIFDPKKGESFFDPPTAPHLPQNLKNVGFRWGGFGGGADQKLSGGCAYWTK